MKKILVVEDSPMVMKVIKHVLSGIGYFDCLYATTFVEAQTIIESNSGEIFASLVDLHLPDAPNGEVVDYVLSHNVPTIVLTGSFNEEKRTKLLSKGIVDYVIKEGRFSYEYACGVLVRMVKNQSIKVLVVDDSETARRVIGNMLRLHMYQVLEAADGVQAIKIVLEHPDLRLLITDYNMPRMDGCELVKNIRLKYEKSDLVIIGLSSESEGTLSARFIKSGANDFLRKPFHHEEFYCRVSHNVEFLELIESIRDAANRDELTGAYSRKYFYQCSQAILEESAAKGLPVSAAVVDIEGLQEINEEYGLDVGDTVLKTIAHDFSHLMDRFIYARAAGKKFYFLFAGLDSSKAVAVLDKIRQIICSEPIDIEGCGFTITFSAGVSTSLGATDLDSLIAGAYHSLRRAVEAGGDLVFGDD